MDNVVYLAASAANETMVAQTINANNLANASTTGFRAGLIAVESVYLKGDGAPSRVFASTHDNGVDHAKGAIQTTGRSLDVAVNDDGWMAVLAADGSEAYSRRGDLRVNDLGQLLDGAGREILGEAGPIALPPFSEMEVGTDGTVSIVPLGEPSSTLTVIDRIKLVRVEPASLYKNSEGLLQLVDGGEAPADASVTLTTGALESSNVNTVESMVRMIELARQFETDVKIMETAQQMDQASTELMQLS